MGVAGGDKATPSRWGDYDNDGRPDLYVSSYIDQPLKEHDFLYHNEGGRFVDVLPRLALPRGATHGVQWVDFDGSGYCSQNVLPVHVGLPSMGRVDVEVTTMTPGGRKVTRTTAVRPAARSRCGPRLGEAERALLPDARLKGSRSFRSSRTLA